MATSKVAWGPTGEAVFNRTYSRVKDDGMFESWTDTTTRVITGNLSLVYGPDTEWDSNVWREYNLLKYYMDKFGIIPAGRQLWASGVPGRQYLFNCHVSGWGEKFSDHFAFTFMRLVEGGGVGANYTGVHTKKYGLPRRKLNVNIVCDRDHQDYIMMDGIVAPRRASNLIVQDTREGWADALTWIIDQAYTDDPIRGQMTHVIDVSKVRPQGSPLVTSGGTAAGPAPLARMLVDVADVLNRIHDQDYMSPVDVMEIDHHISVGAIAGGKRRSARMSIVHWKDPYIMDFINSKNDGRLHWSTNLSVEIDSEFLAQLRLDKDPMQCNDYRAEIVHGAVCDAVLKNGEPGYWNSELSQIGETGVILSTNPCGEIPLEPWEACNLGHVNLDAFVDYENWNGYDWNGLVEAHRLVTRFLIRSTFADINDPRQRAIQDKNRRIGVGHFGVQAFWAKQGVKYSDIPHSSGRNNPKTMLKMLYRHVRDTARDYAFDLRIPEPVKVTTVAPTGTIAKLPGTTEGIHPIYGKWYERRVRFSKRDEREFGQVLEFMNQGFKIEDDIYDPSGMTSVVVFPTEDLLISQVRNLVNRYDLDFDESVVQSADELTLRDMLDMQEMYQVCWADNAVSYTCNIAPGTVDSVDLQRILKEFLPSLKGTTIMVDESREQAPYTRITQEEYAAAAAKRIEDSTDESCSTGACPVK